MPDYVNAYLKVLRKFNSDGTMDNSTWVVPEIKCADGFKMSVQASHTHYCSPRTDRGPWYRVEIGFPSEKEESIMEWAEEPEKPTETVYGYVPVDVINALIERRGGLAD